MRVVFAGTPAFSLPSLEALITHPAVEVVGVFTQPDRPAGRGRKITESPVKKRAAELGIMIFQPESFNAEEALDALRSLQPDLMIVIAYGLILPEEVLDIPRLGCINVHASLLPRWRGAAPIQRAIEAGDRVTGVTLMQMEPGLDTGPILATVELPIGAEETGGSLHDKLSVAGGGLLSAALDAIRDQRLTPTPQPADQVTYANKLTKAESTVDWTMSATEIARKIRALNPWPVATTTFNAMTIRLLQGVAHDLIGNDKLNYSPGEIIEVNDKEIIVAAGEGQVSLQWLQRAGGKPMGARSFCNGVNLTPGMRFG